MERPQIFGLTGGIGSGKSTVATHFRGRGLPVIDADVLARQVVAVGSAALEDIQQTFGSAVILPDGSLDRLRLAAEVFGNAESLAKLNNIVHPRVQQLAEQRFAVLARQGEPLICYEVPLLFETGLARHFRPCVVVVTSEELQISRTQARDGLTIAAIRQRIAAQWSLTVKQQLADYVIDNSGTLEATFAQADAVLDTICQSLEINPTRYTRTVL